MTMFKSCLRALPVAALALSLGGCAPDLVADGAAPVTLAPGLDLMIQPTKGGDANMVQAESAVRDALGTAGYKLVADSAHVAEIGFAIDAPKTGLSQEGGEGPARTFSASPKPFAILCRQQSYILSLVVANRRTGAIEGHARAAMTRCSGDLATIIPTLAQAAVARLHS